jgi:type II secretory pathway pseudopilin PulG
MITRQKQWQLLLVADDGRIVPFKRIKGIAVTLVVVLALLALVCAGLGWRLSVNRVKQRQTFEQLRDARRQIAQYKSELELTTAELVLAEARMEKAGLAIHSRQEQAEQQPVKTVDAAAVSDTGDKTVVDDSVTTTEQPLPSTEAAMSPPVVSENEPADMQAAPVSLPATPVVALGDLKLKHDIARKVVLARFRVNNTGPRSRRVAGRCVVVLKNERMDSKEWLAMPDVTLINGKPDGEKGQRFRISRFIDMKIKAAAPADLSTYNKATVYVFDEAGSTIVEKDFPIDLPQPAAKAVSRSATPTAVESVATDAATADLPAEEPAPLKDSGKTTENLPTATPANADGGQGPQPVSPSASADDPSLIDSVIPVKKEDGRLRD